MHPRHSQFGVLTLSKLIPVRIDDRARFPDIFLLTRVRHHVFFAVGGEAGTATERDFLHLNRGPDTSFYEFY